MHETMNIKFLITLPPSDGQSPASQREVSGSIPYKFTWTLWWKMWHCDRSISRYFSFPLSVPLHRRSILNFPRSVPLHRRSILIHSSTTDAV